MEPPPRIASVDDLREAVGLACRTTYAPRMLRGRAWVLSSPKAWVLAHVERVAEDAIDWDDYWDYRRLLELYALLDPRLLPCATEKGLISQDPDVREAAEDFRDPAYVELIRANLTRGLTQVYPELGGLDRRAGDQHDGDP
jgi:hypothetical protein